MLLDKLNKASSPPKSTPTSQPRQISTASPSAAQQKADAKSSTPSSPATSSSFGRRLSRSGSVDRNPNVQPGTSPGRRNSWFSNISAKFSSTSAAATSPTQAHPATSLESSIHEDHDESAIADGSQQGDTNDSANGSAVAEQEPNIPRVTPVRNAVLQHGTKPEGNAPYTPAPPRSGQAGLLGVFRRLSSSSGSHHAGGRIGNGLVERKVLNVDQHRERCGITELKQAKLRRVSFCVDVEVAPMPKYSDGEVQPKPIDKTIKKKLTEKGEGEALKHPKAVEEEVESEEAAKQQAETTTTPSNTDGSQDSAAAAAAADKQKPPASPDPNTASNGADKDDEHAGDGASRKKDKKKRSDDERKVRKEKRRRLAEESGSIPLEIHVDSSDSSPVDTPDGTPGGSASPRTYDTATTSPVRIYRRCCQLRETPILKKITEQLLDTTNTSAAGIVHKLDLTGYWMQLADLVTLGDYLAVVPVREVLLENTGLTDEGLRGILAGLLAVNKCEYGRKKLRHGLKPQGGVVERLVLKNNKLGPDGWKHLSLFLYMCRSLKALDISHVLFPRQAPPPANSNAKVPRTIAEIFSMSLSQRLAGPTLETINLGEVEPSMDQLGTIMDGIIKCRVPRLGLAHNNLDEKGIAHIGQYLSAGFCEGLDLGGNDLSEHMDKLASSLETSNTLWALSVAGCNLNPSSLSKIMPTLTKLEKLRFIDLSHNQDLFNSKPSAVGLLRRSLPKMKTLKRIHLQDVNLNSDQAIALVEIVPEVPELAHINLLDNTELAKLAHAKTEAEQEDACALFASLMAAARVSESIICIDIEVPGDEAGEIVKAMAKQVVAYCLRNMELLPDTNIGAAVAAALSDSQAEHHDKAAAYPDVLAHLVGHDVMDLNEEPDENDEAPDEDYVIGGTGVVKALQYCLENRAGDESRRGSGEFVRDATDSGSATPKHSFATAGKAKDMTKHLLAGARKIRLRLQPALAKARNTPDDEMNLRKLLFLDDTLQGIIKRFEDEFPETREEAKPLRAKNSNRNGAGQLSTSPAAEVLPSSLTTEDSAVIISDGEDENEVQGPKTLSRSNSMLSKTLDGEEGRILREGHRFRQGMAQPVSQPNNGNGIDLVASIESIGSDPNHARVLNDLAEDIGGEFLDLVRDKGALQAYREDREALLKSMRESDTDHWDRFVEAQNKALQNIILTERPKPVVAAEDESAIAD